MGTVGFAAGWSTLCPRFNERSDVEATTRLASEAMSTHNPYEPFTPFGSLANHPQHLDKPQKADYSCPSSILLRRISRFVSFSR